MSMLLNATTTSTVSEALATGLTTTASDIMSAVATILPIGLGVFGAFLVVKYGKKFFTKISNG